MAAPDLALQKAMVAAIKAGVSAVSGRVFDRAPQDVAYPWIQIGEWQVINDGAECIDGVEIYAVLHVWSRDTGKGFPEARSINWALKAALDGVDLPLDEPFALSEIQYQDTRYSRDPDGLTIHAVVNFKAMIEA